MKFKHNRQLIFILLFILFLITIYFNYGTGYVVLQRQNFMNKNANYDNKNPFSITPNVERTIPSKEIIIKNDNSLLQKQLISNAQLTQCTSDSDCEGKVKDALLVKCEKGICKPKCIDSNGNAMNNWPKSSFTTSECTDKNGQTWKSSCAYDKGSNAPLYVDYYCNKQGDCVEEQYFCPCGLTEDKSSIVRECEAGACVGCPGSDYKCSKPSSCGSLSTPPPPCLVGQKCDTPKTFGSCKTDTDCADNKDCYFMNRDGVKRFGCFCDIATYGQGYCFQTLWSKDNAKIS